MLLCLLTGLATAACSPPEPVGNVPAVDVLSVRGTVNPVLVDYIKRGITQAERDALACVIQLDTPGGLDTSMRDIVQDILEARVPVVVYVSPPGARAASAGTFITLAAHVAVMAPNTVIGAAHPVSIGTEPSSTEEEKILNDAAAYIRTLALSHNRNANWAERAVRDSVSATETEALQLGVIDLLTPDLNSLLTQLDGRHVTLAGSSEPVTLHSAGAMVREIKMDLGESFLFTIASPDVAYLLLGLGMLGITVEVFSPGLIFPGVIGGIALLLGFYALGVLPVNWAGVLLIVLAFGLFIAEAFTHGFGALGAGGLASLVLGSLILFKGGPLFMVSPWLIALVAIIVAGFLTFAVSRVIRAHRQQATTGREELVGKRAVVRRALDPEGMVFYDGELWEATSENGPIETGQQVIIKRVDGLKLYVSRKEGGK